MKMFVILALIISFSTFAKDESKHMVTFGSDYNSGWNLSSSKSDVDSGLGIDDYDISKGRLSLNYAYRIVNQFQLGLSLGSTSEETETKYNGSGGSGSGDYKVDTKRTSFYLFGIFNFSEDFTETFYVLGGYGQETIENTTKDDRNSTASKSESDVNSYMFQIGKRFNLKAAGIQNLVYSPAISYKFGTVGGDLNDEGVESISTIQLDLVKFDLLF